MPSAAGDEERLLLECSRGRLNDQSTATIATLIARGLDWTKLVALALHHRVVPALLPPLTELSVRSLVPVEILAALHHYGDATRERNRYLAAELGSILSALAGEGITALPFKGGLLAEMLYGDLGQRPPGDLDFLVRPRDVTRVCEVLVSRGYRNPEASAIRTPTQHDMFRRYQCEYHFVRDVDGVVAEPHWAFAQRVRAVDLDYEAQFARARPSVFAGAPVTIHAPEDLVLLLCVHGAKHEWERLGWIRDLAAILERRADLGLDLDLALARAAALGCARLMLLGVEVAHQLLDAPLPSNLREAIRRDPGVAPLVNRVTTSLFRRDRPPEGNARISSFGFRMHERAVSRMRYVIRTLLLPRREHIALLALPASLAWAYYPLRWGHDYVALPLWMLIRPLRMKRAPRETAPGARC